MFPTFAPSPADQSPPVPRPASVGRCPIPRISVPPAGTHSVVGSDLMCVTAHRRRRRCGDAVVPSREVSSLRCWSFFWPRYGTGRSSRRPCSALGVRGARLPCSSIPPDLGGACLMRWGGMCRFGPLVHSTGVVLPALEDDKAIRFETTTASCYPSDFNRSGQGAFSLSLHDYIFRLAAIQ